ncbi:MAG TPA: hypothetical protein VIL46_07485 [Gemmataceae bacterium]
MKRMLGGLMLAAVSLGPAGVARAADDTAAQKLIDQAVRAQAGTPERLEKMANMTQTMRGGMTSPAGELPARRNVEARWPEHCRITTDLVFNDQQARVVLTLAGSRGWRAGPEGPAEMSAAELDELRAEVYASWVTTLLPLKEKGWAFSLLPEARVNGRDAVGVRVTRKGRPDVQLYFDKQTHLPVKTVFRAKEAGLNIVKEWVLSDHKSFEGLTLPAKLTVLYDGRKVATWAVTEYRFPARIDDATFEKP